MSMPKDIERIAYQSPESLRDHGANPPRWTPGSLAEAVADWQMEGPERRAQADAVQRLTVCCQAYLEIEGSPGEDDARGALCAALYDIQNWGTR